MTWFLLFSKVLAGRVGLSGFCDTCTCVQVQVSPYRDQGVSKALRNNNAFTHWWSRYDTHCRSCLLDHRQTFKRNELLPPLLRNGNCLFSLVVVCHDDHFSL